MLQKYFDKNNLHHAYLIEGDRELLLKEITDFVKSIGVSTINNPDFIQINLDSFKIEDARNLKSYTSERGLSTKESKKIFIISANNFLIEAQNSLLKLFEEPIKNTHFFIITPQSSIFIKTLISRFYFISTKQALREESKQVEQFIKMSPKARIDFIKEMLAEKEEVDEIQPNDSNRAKSLKFLNALESTFHDKMPKMVFDPQVFEHIFNVRKFLRQPGSSAKTLLESVALITPDFSN